MTLAFSGGLALVWPNAQVGGYYINKAQNGMGRLASMTFSDVTAGR